MRFLFFLLFCLILTGCGGDHGTADVIHGGGIMWEYDSDGMYRAFAGSNSREAFVRCGEMGECTVEIDFCFTSDGELVCIHGWDREYIAGITDGVPLSLAEFSSSRIYGCFTPMSASDAAEIMREYGTITLVTDIKEDFYTAAQVIADIFADMLDRVVIQIYSPGQYDHAVGLGFSRIAYTLYRLDWNDKLDADAHVEFARFHRLEWIAFSEELCDNALFVGKMKESGVPLYVHTVNDSSVRKKCLDNGLSGVYTDNIK